MRAADRRQAITAALDGLRRLGVRGLPALPVVAPATGRLPGVVHRGSVLALYDQAVAGANETFPA